MAGHDDRGADTPSANANADALVVDLVYGELDGDAERHARARVESEPELAASLAGYQEVRASLRDLPEAEPPAAIRAGILAAAAEASQPRRGLWNRLKDLATPVALHPGLAAAATLVLVVGVAGLLYVRGAGDLAEPARRPARAAANAGAAAGAAEPPVTAPADEAARADDSVAPTGEIEEAAPASADHEGEGARRPPSHRPAGGAASRSEAKSRSRAPAASPPDDAEPPRTRTRKRGLPRRRSGSKAGRTAPRRERAPAPESRGRAAGAGAPAPLPEGAEDAPEAAPPEASADDDAGEGAGGAPATAPREAPADAGAGEGASLYRRAAAAARRGACDRALEIAARIRERAPRTYRERVVPDAAIARCREAR